jgi:hypothetical protein
MLRLWKHSQGLSRECRDHGAAFRRRDLTAQDVAESPRLSLLHERDLKMRVISGLSSCPCIAHVRIAESHAGLYRQLRYRRRVRLCRGNQYLKVSRAVVLRNRASKANYTGLDYLFTNSYIISCKRRTAGRVQPPSRASYDAIKLLFALQLASPSCTPHGSSVGSGAVCLCSRPAAESDAGATTRLGVLRAAPSRPAEAASECAPPASLPCREHAHAVRLAG